MSALPYVRYFSVALCAFGAAAWLTAVWTAPEFSSVLGAYRSRLDAELVALRRPAVGAQVLSAQWTLSSGLLVWAAATRTWVLGALCIAVWLSPHLILAARRARRMTLLEAQLDPWLLALANALRATPSLGDALASTSAMLAAPLREEIDHILKEWRLGVPLDRALHATGSRVGSRTLSAALLTLRIARASGGGVSSCLEAAAAALREMARLDAVVRVKTAEGKAQALVIAALPLPFVGLLQWLDPTFLAPLLLTARGHTLLAVCGALWLSAVLLARRIVQLDL